jgi:hypothetical protein
MRIGASLKLATCFRMSSRVSFLAYIAHAQTRMYNILPVGEVESENDCNTACGNGNEVITPSSTARLLQLELLAGNSRA